MIHYGDILLVVVIYNCIYKETLTYKTLLSRYFQSKVFVYDNSPKDQKIFDRNVVYVHDSKNRGLGVAYNKSAQFAYENHFKWILLLDQDSDCSNINLDSYIEAINTHYKIRLFSSPVLYNNKYMSPVYIKDFCPKLKKEIPHMSILSLNTWNPINSGMCINVESFIECGGYNENVFLDYSDFQFLERFKKKNDLFLLLKDCIKQNYSAFTDSKEMSVQRYILFYKSIKNFETNKTKIKLSNEFVLFKRALALLFRNRTIKPMYVYIKNIIEWIEL